MKAGADMIFPEGLESEKEFELFAKELKADYPEAYLLANMTEFGKSPCIPLKRLKELNYDVVIYPVSTLRIAAKAVELFLDNLVENGTVDNSLNDMLTRKDLYTLLKYKPGEEWIYPNSLESDKKI